ncbi:PAS domain S-box-containing protein/diguanylate cyclase (GGDEF)-like protein [Halanaerobium saccharolyticum]|jgi:diguanylate cyclase (GGDEF)-like protein/PAS domain S-box-containing protein|uniref:PAS domain S-box-containing protein/diguanylate cyclase (GGDEF)-like protein n=1 Tax=Halanaerobium saccharolyticum TaxID=43595 RepID=A0A2T5RGA7_9FIRM|nr:HD domain-containing phosphohydrolase [Halanaerobium saccharolyticum]PTV93538.1 PAS domain S-box-containing protein/diguanylate cyclase (GGDEF)-like protein [Halanaerobium saccharolyticum]
MLLDQNQALSSDLKEFLDLSPYAAVFINQQGEVVYLNRKAAEFVEASCLEWNGCAGKFNYLNFIEQNMLPESELLIKNIKLILEGEKEKYKFDYCWDENIYFEVKITKFKAGVLLLYENISKRKITEKKLRSLEKRYRTIFDHGPMGILLLDSEGRVLQANQTFVEYTGYSKSELIGSTIFETVVLEENKEEAEKFIDKILAGAEVEYIGQSLRKNGEVFPILFKERAIEIPGQGKCILSMQLDYSEYQKQQQRIEYIGYHDQLTGCYNRSYIENKLKEYDQAEYLPLAVVMIDINGLTLINESYGYKTGDQLLIKVAAELKTLLGDSDLLGRWSGDEFIILLPESSKQQLADLREAVNIFCNSTAEDEIPVSLGFGAAAKNELKANIYQVINQADRNMNQDKLTKSRSSKNKFVKNLINTLGAKSNETKEHALRMTSLAFKLGDRLRLSHEKLNELNLLATLHDIGKVTIAESILNKPGKLTEEEWEIVKSHPVKGAAIADSTAEFSPIAKYIRHHHERWDGGGYPEGLAEHEIPLLSRIITLVDSYDVMTNDRPYKEPMTKLEAVKEISRCAGTQFDPELAVEFIKLLEEEEEA